MDTVIHTDADPPVVRSRPQTVLLVEDDAALRRCISRVLEHHGRHVLCAADGVEAIDVFREHQDEVDVVILDLSMPRSDGPAALARLRSLDPDVPVIISSGYLDTHIEALMIVGSIQGVLAKPYTTKQMLELLQSF